MLVGYTFVKKDVPDDRALPIEVTKLSAGSPEAKVAMLHNMLSLSFANLNYFIIISHS